MTGRALEHLPGSSAAAPRHGTGKLSRRPGHPWRLPGALAGCLDELEGLTSRLSGRPGRLSGRPIEPDGCPTGLEGREVGARSLGARALDRALFVSEGRCGAANGEARHG